MGAGAPIDTGPGGFDVEGQTYTYDVGVSEADGGSQGPYKAGVDVSAGYVDGSGQPKDLTTKTKTTLSQYLSNLTSGKGTNTQVANRYPVDAGYKAQSTTTKTGNPTLQTPGAAGVGNSKAFVTDEQVLSALSDSFSKLADFRKGKGDQGKTDGNDLLPGLPGDVGYSAEDGKLTGTGPTNPPKPVKGHPDTTGVVKPYVSAVLKNNRFSSAADAFYPETPVAADFGASGFNPKLPQQGRLGAYDPQAKGVSFEQLATIGPLLTLRAGKELGANSPKTDPNSGLEQASAGLLPGVAQLGVTQIDPTTLYASDVLASGLTDDLLKDSFVISPGTDSWGALNNTDDPFSGMDALGMSILSIALVGALELLIDGISALLGLITSQAKKPNHDAQGRYSLGEYYAGEKQAHKAAGGGIGGAIAAVGSLNFGALLGIQPTNYPFSQALSVGANAFFGLPQDAGIGGQLLGVLASAIDSPGFNVVVIRAILRGGIAIVNQAKKIGGNPMNAINQILALMDTIRESKLIAACNIFAMLGDAILVLPKDFIDPDALGGIKVSQQDQIDNALANGVNKSRLKGGLKLAWASNRAPAQLLLPTNVLGPAVVITGLGQFDPLLGSNSDPLSRVQSKVLESQPRIDPDTAAAFEATLDAEYVPFYFHDLRTNEMVAFHAFLASMTDDFTASYEKSDGYGRVEPVRTYRGTERRIGLSFYVVATSLQDFDEMWVKINKLVTLVYPQFTKGIQLASSDGTSYKFTQPFSQLIGASPLIRLRLGDLLKSNYSRFGLARLFGLGNDGFALNGQTDDTPVLSDDDMQKYTQALQQAFSSPADETYLVAPGVYPFIDPSSGAGLPGPPVPALGSSSGPKFAPQFNPSAAPPGLLVIKAKSVDPNSPSDDAAIQAGSTQLICEVMLNDDPAYSSAYKQAIAAATFQFGDPGKPLQNYIGGTYSIPISCLTPTQKTKTDIVQKALNAAGGSPFATEVSNFLLAGGANANALAKSFRDTGGKGLAGFIETMNFDWYDKVTWETTLGRTAPKMCKVTISFSPVHDITPGLDHFGMNRAPVYPVGLLAQQFDATTTGAGST